MAKLIKNQAEIYLIDRDQNIILGDETVGVSTEIIGWVFAKSRQKSDYRDRSVCRVSDPSLGQEKAILINPVRKGTSGAPAGRLDPRR